MSDEPKQGRLANSAGSTLENTVIGTLTSNGFKVVSYRDYEERLVKEDIRPANIFANKPRVHSGKTDTQRI